MNKVYLICRHCKDQGWIDLDLINVDKTELNITKRIYYSGRRKYFVCSHCHLMNGIMGSNEIIVVNKDHKNCLELARILYE